jgi:hypothetical protein
MPDAVRICGARRLREPAVRWTPRGKVAARPALPRLRDARHGDGGRGEHPQGDGERLVGRSRANDMLRRPHRRRDGDEKRTIRAHRHGAHSTRMVSFKQAYA